MVMTGKMKGIRRRDKKTEVRERGNDWKTERKKKKI